MTFKCFRFVSLLLSRKKKKKKKKQNGVVLVFHLFITERSWPSTKIPFGIKKTQRERRREEREKREKKTSKTGSHKKMNFIDKNKKPANTGGIDETVKLAAGKLDGLPGMHEYGDRQKDYTWDCVIFGDGS